MKTQIVMYRGKNGAITLKGDFQRETFWASQSQIIELFDVDQSVVSRHINNIFKSGEIELKSNMQKMHIANSDKPITFYSLDVILAVGYRTNSKVAIEFRKWATKTLRDFITKGYLINRTQIAKHYDEFLQAVESIKSLLPAGDKIKAEDALELVKMFANTWLSLHTYDSSSFPKIGASRSQVSISAEELNSVIAQLKQELIRKKEATELFAQERQNDSLEGILGNIFQSVFGEDAYKTVDEKAAHLLYFMVKNHPFTDGNKRSGAFAFIWFLHKAGLLNKDKISPEALTALTLLVAESNPKDKERVIGLILHLLKG